MYAPNIRASRLTKQLLTDLREEIESNTIIEGNFNTPHTLMDRSPRLKINKETVALNDTLQHMDVIDIYRKFQVHIEHYPGQITC